MTPQQARPAPGQAGPAGHALSRALARIAEHEPRVRAWAWLDEQAAREQADQLDRSDPQPLTLLGLTVGLKDIIDTAGMPTENGTVLHAGRRPLQDADVVQRLRAAGAVILGKTVTTELATYAPGVTRNPWNERHTPGGSSSGSAAAVACGMADVALGSQTNGSTIRPASFCGVVGFKPGRDRIPRRGMLVQSPTFDTVGLFATDVRTVTRLYQALIGDGRDAGQEAAPPAPESQARLTAQVAWWPTPWWSRVAEIPKTRLVQAAGTLGALEHPATTSLQGQIAAEEIVRLHGLIMEAEIARSFDAEFERGREQLSASLQGQITRGRSTDDAQLEQMRTELWRHRQMFDQAWPEGLDAIALPASTGTAPEGLTHTGDPIMCTMATALDLPAISLPLVRGEQGLPLGLQLIGRRGCEDRLLRTALQCEAAWPRITPS